MKLGAENRTTVIVAVALAAVALFMVWRTFFGGSGEVSATPAPAAAQTAPASNAGPAARRITRGARKAPAAPTEPTVTASLDPRLRLDLLKGSEQTDYKGSGRNIFIKHEDVPIPTPVDNGLAKNKPAPVPAPEPQGPPPPPPPPPINLKFFGLLNRSGEPRQAFLLQNDEVFVAKEGDVVNRRYKVVKINNNSVEIEDLLGNNKQVIPLTAG